MRKLLFILITLSLIHCICQASGVEGMHEMEPVGQGEIRYFGLIKIYEATLYTEKAAFKKSVLNPNTSRCLKLEYSLSLSARDIIQGANAIMARQNSPAKLARVQAGIDRLHAALKDVKGGDRYLICYNAMNKKTTLLLNEHELVSITSAEFGTVYFGIWLGAVAPIDERLRDKLLSN